MENVQESTTIKDTIKNDEIIKQVQQQQQPVIKDIENVHQPQLKEPQQQQQQQLEEATKQNETTGEKSAEAPPVIINEVFEGEEDDEDDDDDEEKDTSQKLIIDIPDEEEEEEEEKEGDEDNEDDVITLEEIPPAEHLPAKEEVNERNESKATEAQTIITLSDGEEDIPVNEMPSKPGKVQKRRSASTVSRAGDDEEQFRLKRRKINVAGAPKMPPTGYVRYMNDRRESLRKEHPSKPFVELTKMIGEEWHSLPTDVKASYLKAAAADKQRYDKELHTFLKSRPDVLASELAKTKARKNAENNSPNPSTTVVTAAGTTTSKQPVLKEKSQTNDNAKTTKDTTLKDKSTKELAPTPSTSQQALDNNKTLQEKNKSKRTPTPPTTYTNASSSNTTTSSTTIGTPAPGEIPIFTNEFLEHNKIYDMELRTLRKSKTDLEQQNSVLEKHVENMKFGVEKMITENNELEEKNRLLEIYLDKLKRKLALALASLPLPSAPNGATVDNIEKYMQDLHKMSTSNSHGPATLNKAKDIIRKLDLQIQL